MLLYEPEPTPMDLRFRLFGTDVRVHPLFWLITAVLGWQAIDFDDPVLPGNGMGDLALWVFCVFFSILLHEFGHVWMGWLFGTEGHIVLHGMGGLAIGSNNLSARWKRILVSFAGPVIQLLLWAVIVAFLWVGFLQRINFFDLVLAFFEAPDAAMLLLFPEHKPLALMVGALLFINLFWPLFNLLPVWPLDGGMITREVCTGVAPSRGLIVSLWISLIVSATIAVNALMAMHQRKGFIPYLPAGGMFTVFLFAMLAAGSFQALQIENSRRRSYDDDLPWER